MYTMKIFTNFFNRSLASYFFLQKPTRQWFTSQVKVKLGISTRLFKIKAEKPTLVGKKNRLFGNLVPQRTGVFHLPTEMDGPNSSEMDIKVFINAPTFYLQDK